MPRHPSHPALFRHALAACAAIALVTTAFTLLGFSLYRDALLNNTAAPFGERVRSSFVFAVIATTCLFAPAALGFEWLLARRRTTEWLPPFLLAPLLACVWSLLHRINGTYEGESTWITAAVVGIGLSTTFCAYWIPLRFTAARLKHLTDAGQKAE